MEKNENKISFDIRGCAFKIHTALGPGLFESVYEAALSYELTKLGYQVKNQTGIPMLYENIRMDVGFRLDILVNDLVIVEIKSVEKMADIYFKKLLTYLKLSNRKLGIIINFNSVLLKDKESIFRIVNNL